MKVDRRSERALDCFAHGLAHLTDELGIDEALRLAASAVLSLIEDRELVSDLGTGPGHVTIGFDRN